MIDFLVKNCIIGLFISFQVTIQFTRYLFVCDVLPKSVLFICDLWVIIHRYWGSITHQYVVVDDMVTLC